VVRSRPHRIGLRNDGELRASVAGDHIALDQASFITDAGRFSVTGELQGESLRAVLAGQLDLEFLQPLPAQEVSETGRRCQSGSEGVRDHDPTAG